MSAPSTMLLSPIFVAGFYYKTFMWPRSFWGQVYEPAIRAAAGLGRAPTRAGPRHATSTATPIATCSWSAQVRRASRPRWRLPRAASASSSPTSRPRWAARCCTTSAPASTACRRGCGWPRRWPALASRENVTLLPRTTAFGYYNHNHLGLVQRVTDHLAKPPPDLPRERLWQVRAGEVVLATGAHERPLVFPGNDRPGIMLAESLRAFVNRYGVAPGQRAVIVTSGASAYTAAPISRPRASMSPSSTCVRKRLRRGGRRACAPPAARCWPGTPCSDRPDASASAA